MKRSLCLAGLALLVAGCATTPVERIARNQAAFDSWPAAVQTKIREGRIDLGFTPEQVRVALGEPDGMVSNTTVSGTTETWTYHGSRTSFAFGLGVAGGGGRTGYGGGVAVSDHGRGRGGALHVVFKNGAVITIEGPRRGAGL